LRNRRAKREEMEKDRRGNKFVGEETREPERDWE